MMTEDNTIEGKAGFERAKPKMTVQEMLAEAARLKGAKTGQHGSEGESCRQGLPPTET